MAEISAAAAASLAAEGRRLVSSAQGTGGTPAAGSLDLPDGLRARLTGPAPVRLDVAAARNTLGRSITAGHQIVSALRTLAGTLDFAVQSGLVSPQTSLLSGDGTRVSRLNIQAAAGRIIAAIDDLVASVADGAANFIASGARPVRIQTTGFGGRLDVAPQPLDAEGLRLAEIAVLERGDAREAAARVRTAIATAEQRLGDLHALQSALGFASPALQTFDGTLASGADLLPRGSLVDLSA